MPSSEILNFPRALASDIWPVSHKLTIPIFFEFDPPSLIRKKRQGKDRILKCGENFKVNYCMWNFTKEAKINGKIKLRLM